MTTPAKAAPSPNTNRPEDYPRRILIAVSGLSPAILTETLYALAVESEIPFIPTEIHLITTIEGRTRAENSLLKGEKPVFPALCRDYGLTGIGFDRDHIHVIENDAGPMNDIRTPEDNEAAADFITGKIREFTRDEDAAVHVSIAGGRKTMGYYVGYALSLFGRRQDRLSHVLVDMDYETCPEFFYPTPHEVIRNNRDNKPVDFSEAKVYLAQIPFVRIRDHVPENARKKDGLMDGRISFSDAVQHAQVADRAESLVIDLKNKLVVANGVAFSWSGGKINLYFYAWFIQQIHANGTALECPFSEEPNPEYKASFMELYQREDSKRFTKGMEKGFFDEAMSHVKKSLMKGLGAALASHFGIVQATDKAGFYTLAFDPKGIHCQIICK